MLGRDTGRGSKDTGLSYTVAPHISQRALGKGVPSNSATARGEGRRHTGDHSGWDSARECERPMEPEGGWGKSLESVPEGTTC